MMDCSCNCISIVIVIILGYKIIRWLMRLPVLGDYKSKYVFITGCDTGFGNRLARRLDTMGFHVFAGCFTDDGANGLNEIAPNICTIPLDVSQPKSIQKAVLSVQDSLPNNKGLWAVVNNAGISGGWGPLEWFDREDYLEVLSVNLLGTIDMCRMFLPLVRRETGRFVNCSSLAGRLAASGLMPYTVTKYGVEAFSDSLRRELYCEGMSVHIIEPLAFKTPIMEISKLVENTRSRYDKLTPEMKKFYGESDFDHNVKTIKLTLDGMVNNNVDLVVDDYVHAITARYPRQRYMPGNFTKHLFCLLIYLPEWLSDWLLCYMTKKPEGAT